MSQRLRVVVDDQDAGMLVHFLPPAARWSLRADGWSGFGLFGDRQREGEKRSEALSFALRPYAPPVGFDDALADGQTQAGPFDLPSGAVAFDSDVLAEEVGQSLGGNSPSLVGDRESDVQVLPLGPQPDGRELPGVLGRVGEQIAEDL